MGGILLGVFGALRGVRELPDASWVGEPSLFKNLKNLCFPMFFDGWRALEAFPGVPGVSWRCPGALRGGLGGAWGMPGLPLGGLVAPWEGLGALLGGPGKLQGGSGGAAGGLGGPRAAHGPKTLENVRFLRGSQGDGPAPARWQPREPGIGRGKGRVMI